MAPRAPMRRSASALPLLLVAIFWIGFAVPEVVDAVPGSVQVVPTLDASARMDANNLDMALTNYGGLAYDLNSFDPGLLYPKGTNQGVVFAAGLWLGAKVNGTTRIAVGEYLEEYSPGPMSSGTYLPDNGLFKNYRIERGGLGYSDYQLYAVPQGAPTDVNGDPLLLGDVTIWSVFNDANPGQHVAGIGGTAPLGVEVQQSVFAFNRSGPLGDAVFVKWRLANLGGNRLDSMYVALWVDPDIGGPSDDVAGCDTTRGLGYAYNATNLDGVYGATPPAVGFDLLQGPVSQGDTLGMTAFVRYVSGADPQSPEETYHNMKGLRADGSPIHVCDDPLQPVTTYDVSGLDLDAPPSCSNWLDSGPSDRRFVLSSGPFTMQQGDTQVVIFAIEVGRSTDRLASVADLLAKGDVVQAVYGLSLPTAVEAFLIESAAEAGAVRLAWRVAESPGTRVTLERRTESTAWHAVGDLILPSDRIVRFEDPSVSPGRRYGYRLAITTDGRPDYSAESWVDVPEALGAPSRVELLPGRPNPSSATFQFAHFAPREGAYRLMVLDVHGRVVRVLQEAMLSRGWHDATWDGRDEAGREAASGVYVLRIEGQGEADTQRVVLMR